MKKYITIVSLICLSGFLFIFAQEDKQKNQNQISITEQWMNLDCKDESNHEQLVEALRKNPQESEQYFINMIEKGPTNEQIQAEKDAIKELFEIRSSFNNNQDRKITFEGEAFENEKPGNEDEKTFMKRRMDDFKYRLTVRAMEGLKALETPSALKYLKKKASDDNFPFRELAREFAE